MRGFIVVDAEAARRLRSGPAALRARSVLACSGDFGAGDRVHLVVRGRDGGQGVFAFGIVRCEARSLRRLAGNRGAGAQDDAVVIDERDVALLWQRAQ